MIHPDDVNKEKMSDSVADGVLTAAGVDVIRAVGQLHVVPEALGGEVQRTERIAAGAAVAAHGQAAVREGHEAVPQALLIAGVEHLAGAREHDDDALVIEQADVALGVGAEAAQVYGPAVHVGRRVGIGLGGLLGGGEVDGAQLGARGVQMAQRGGGEALCVLISVVGLLVEALGQVEHRGVDVLAHHDAAVGGSGDVVYADIGVVIALGRRDRGIALELCSLAGGEVDGVDAGRPGACGLVIAAHGHVYLVAGDRGAAYVVVYAADLCELGHPDEARGVTARFVGGLITFRAASAARPARPPKRRRHAPPRQSGAFLHFLSSSTKILL